GDEVFPGGGLTPFWRGRNAVPPEHVSDSLVRDVVAEINEGASDPIVAPISVLLGHADDQPFDLRDDSRPARIRAMLRPIELAGDQTTIPAENGLGLGDTRYIGEELAAEPFANFSKRAALGVGEPDLAGHVGAEDPVLRDEAFALEK